jgi:hypothetical protein
MFELPGLLQHYNTEQKKPCLILSNTQNAATFSCVISMFVGSKIQYKGHALVRSGSLCGMVKGALGQSCFSGCISFLLSVTFPEFSTFYLIRQGVKTAKTCLFVAFIATRLDSKLKAVV